MTIRIVRIDGADFVAVSATVSNSDENTGMVVAGYNNNALVGGTSTTVPAGQANITANLATQTVDEIRITGQSNASFSEVGILNNFIVSVTNLPPTLGSYTSTRSYTIGGAAVTLDNGNNATVTDTDSADFNGGSVRVGGYLGEAATQDVLQVGNVGPITLDLGTGNVADSGTVIGQVSSNGQAGADLVVNLNASATPARVQNLMRALQYFNAEPASPYIHSRTLLTSVSDGDGAPAKFYPTTINFTLPADPANTQKVNFNAGTTVPDIATNIPTSFTSQGFTFAISGGSGAYMQGGGTFPGTPGANMGATGGGNLTLTVNRPAGADFSIDSFVFGNATTQNVSVDLRLNGSSVTTRTLPGTFAQRMDFAGITIDEIRVTGNSTASPFFQAGTFDELIYYPANLSPNIGSLQGDTATFTQGGSAVAIDASTAATLSDADSANFDTGSLTVAIVANKWSAQDVLQVGNVGSITVSGANVLDSGTQIGTITGNGSGGNNLVVGFNAQATPARVQNLLRALQYRNTEATLPDLGNRSLQITVLDGDASSPAEVTTTMRVMPSALPVTNIIDLNYSGLGSQPINTTQVDFQNYRMTISGGFQRYLQNSFDGPFSPGIVGGDTGISTQTMSLGRVDAADFFAHSLIVHNHNTSVAMTVKSRNNGVDVQTLSLPAGGTQRLLFNDTLAIDQITIAGTTSSLNALLAFADELAVRPPNVPPTATTTVAALAYTENAAATQIDSGISITDPDNNWNAGTLRVQITANAGATDQLSVSNSGGVSLSGLNVQVSGVTKGTINAATVSLGNPMTVTLNASATTADVRAIARAFAYTNLSDAPSTTTRTVTFTVIDSFNASASATRQITVTAVNDVPALANTSTLAYNENQAATAINTAITVADADHATLASGSVSITANLQTSEDTLSFTNDGATMGNIAGSYVSGSGIMTLTSASATATVAQWQSALRAVRYANSSNTPNTAARTVSYIVNDGVGNATAVNSTINVTAINDLPVAGGSSSVTYAENAAALTINASITVADADHATLASGSVAIGANFASGQDVLAFTNDGATMGNISGNYTAGSGVLALASAGASATLAQWQSALRAVTYFNSSDNPGTAPRTVSFAVNDGGGNSNTISSTVNVTASNDAPALNSGSILSYSENQAATPISPSISVVDPDNAALATATVAITSGLVSAEDLLAFTNVPATMGNISGSFVAGTGVMTLVSSGPTATVAQWQAALRAVSYANSSESPNVAPRTVSYTVNDGSTGSNLVTSTVNVTAVDDAPVLAAAGALSYTENQAPLAVAPALTAVDADTSTLVSGAVSISANFLPGEDTLAFTNVPASMGNIVGSYAPGTGELMLTSAGGTATPAQWQAALRSVTYVNSSDNPSGAARSVSYRVNDGGLDSNLAIATINVIPVNDASVANGGAVVTYAENQAATLIDTTFSVSDLDNATLAAATVAITANFTSGQDLLAFSPVPATMGNIGANYIAGTGVMNLVSAGATATLAQWQEALRAVTYANSSDDPNTSPRTLTFMVNDGGANSNGVTSTINLTAANDAPLLAGPSVLAFNENQAATPINPSLSVVDPDNTTLTSASVAITANHVSGEDVLGFVNLPASMGNITGSFAPAAGVMTLTSAGASATVAQWQAALRAVSYANSSDDPSIAPRTVRYLVNDGGLDSNLVASTINLSAENDAPVLAGLGTLGYTENQPATATHPGITVADADDAALASASVSISGNFVSGQDVLALVSVPATMGNIVGNFSAGAGILTLASAGNTATPAQWQAALRAVTYANTSDDPDVLARTLSFIVNDGALNSNPVSSNINLTAVNDSPQVSAPASMSVVEDTPATLGAVDVADPDARNSALIMTFSVSSGALIASGDANVTVTGSPGASIQASGSAAGLDSWLQTGTAINYQPDNGVNGSFPLSIQTSDNGATPGPAASDSDVVTINLIAVPDAEIYASIDDGRTIVSVGDTVVYTARLMNKGSEAVELSHNARAQFLLPSGLTDLVWSCSGANGGICSASGSGVINDPVALPLSATVTYLIGGTVTVSATPTIDAVFGIAASPPLQSDDPGSSVAVDSDELRMFVDGFE